MARRRTIACAYGRGRGRDYRLVCTGERSSGRKYGLLIVRGYSLQTSLQAVVGGHELNSACL